MSGRAIRRVATLVAPAVGLLLLVYLIAVWILYLRYPSFIDQGEASVAMLALDLTSGHPLYHAIDAAPRTSLVYGPSIYFVHAAFLAAIENPILATKAAGILLCLGSLILGVVSLRRVVGGRWFWIVAVQAGIILLCFSNVSYWNRSDPLILFCVAAIAAIGPYVEHPRFRTAAMVGLALAVAIITNAKVHGALYAAPILYWHLRQTGLATVAGTLLTAAALTIAPFVVLPSLVPFAEYRTWVTLVANHPRDFELLSENLILFAEMLAPIGAIAIFGWRDRPREWRAAAIVLAGCGLIVCVIGGKAGAGVPHLLPFGLPVAWVTAQGLRTPFRRRSLQAVGVAGALVALSAVALGHRALENQKFVVRFGIGADDWHAMDGAVAELRAIVSAYPGASFAMGYGDSVRADRKYRLTYLKPLLYAHGRLNFVDAPALMDMQASGLGIPPATLAFLDSAKADVFLLPATGAPFATTSYYDKRPLFSDDFKRSFAANYVMRETREYFSVWTSRRFASLARADSSSRSDGGGPASGFRQGEPSGW